MNDPNGPWHYGQDRRAQLVLQRLAIPDQIFATVTQYAFSAAVGTAATISAAVLQRQRS